MQCSHSESTSHRSRCIHSQIDWAMLWKGCWPYSVRTHLQFRQSKKPLPMQQLRRDEGTSVSLARRIAGQVLLICPVGQGRRSRDRRRREMCIRDRQSAGGRKRRQCCLDERLGAIALDFAYQIATSGNHAGGITLPPRHEILETPPYAYHFQLHWPAFKLAIADKDASVMKEACCIYDDVVTSHDEFGYRDYHWHGAFRLIRRASPVRVQYRYSACSALCMICVLPEWLEAHVVSSAELNLAVGS